MNICTQCKSQFEITDQDRAFYRKIDVPEPKLCPPCREMRRWAFRNERTLYSRQCGKCKKQIISVYSPDKPYTVYCRECFNGDEFDPLAYGREFDFSRPFFEQFNDLMKSVPLITLIGGTNCVNSEYANLESDAKNCYMNIGGHFNEDCYYNTFALYCKDSVDNYWVLNSELIYESIDCHQSYKCFYCQNVAGSNECWFCYDCRGCTSCFGCVNLRNKKYMIFNKQYTKEEYEEKIAELTKDGGTIEAARKQFEEERLKHPHRFALHDKVENSTGNYLTQCKNVIAGFDIEGGENLKFVQINGWIKDCMDATCAGWGELVYDAIGLTHINNVRFSAFSFPNLNWSTYCAFCRDADYALGCVSLKKNKRCILNRQYTEAEYEPMVQKIIAHMKKTGEWGAFFPVQSSPFCYNETIAQLYFPLSKEEALKRGYKWQDHMPYTTGKETMKASELPVSIDEVKGDGALQNGRNVTKEIIACADCGRNYKIIALEFGFYKRMHLPLPRCCPQCRYEKKMKLRGTSHTLHHRQCMCNLANHGHHANGTQCTNKFETTYAPERPEKVFCEQCYQKEVV